MKKFLSTITSLMIIIIPFFLLGKLISSIIKKIRKPHYAQAK